jgi:hypothetical protein
MPTMKEKLAAKRKSEEPAKANAKAKEEQPYAILTIRFFRKKPFELEGEGFEHLAPGNIHRMMPGVYKELRRRKGKLTFDASRLERDARESALALREEPPVKPEPRKREIV